MHSGRAMLRRPSGSSQAALARPSHCVHTLWAHIEGITHNVEVVGNEIFKKKKKENERRLGAHTLRLYVPDEGAKKSTLFGSGQMRQILP